MIHFFPFPVVIERGKMLNNQKGGAVATTAAWFMKYQLPRTKCILTVPLSELYFFNDKDNGRGILPDKEVPLEKFVNYMQAGKDPELTYTMELLTAP